MGISEKTQKLLWARCGNRCAICKSVLVREAESSSEKSLVGEQCHIVSGRPQGPRHDPAFPAELIDSLENLLVLCAMHHKQVDDLVDDFPALKLRQVKADHEAWVERQLTTPEAPLRLLRIKEGIPDYLLQLKTGSQLYDLVAGAHGFNMNPPDPADAVEAELIGRFLQNAKDYGELAEGFEPLQCTDAIFELGSQLRGVEAAGFVVFGGTEKMRVTGGGFPDETWRVATVVVLRADNPAIIWGDTARSPDL